MDLLCCCTQSDLKTAAVLRWAAVKRPGVEDYDADLPTIHFIAQIRHPRESEYRASLDFTAELRETFVWLHSKYVFYLTFNPILLNIISDSFATAEYWIWKTFGVETALSIVNLPVLPHLIFSSGKRVHLAVFLGSRF